MLATTLVIFSLTNVQAQVISESFEGTFPPAGWEVVTTSGQAWDSSLANPASGALSAFVRSAPTLDTSYLFTPVVSANIADTVVLIFQYAATATGAFSDSARFQLTFGNSQTAMGQTVAASFATVSSAYVTDTIVWPVPATNNYHFGFRVTNGVTSGSLYLDTVVVDLLPQDALCSGLTIDQIAVSPATCFNVADGAAEVLASGGTGPYTYNWGNGTPVPLNPAVVNNLPQGNTSVTVTDANGCVADTTVTIASPAEIVPDLQISNPTTANGTNGFAFVDPSGGQGGPFTVTWSRGVPSFTGDTTNSLNAGNISVTVTDTDGCAVEAMDQLTDFQGIVLAVEDISCTDENDGAVVVTPTGGTAPFQYTWSRGAPGAAPSIRVNLTEGPISVTVTDANGGTYVADTNIVNPPVLEIASIDVTPACNGETNGSLTVNAIGGTPIYRYTFTTIGTSASDTIVIQNNVTNPTISNRPPDANIRIIVRDRRGCRVTLTEAVIPELAPIKLDLFRNEDTLGVTADTFLSYQWFVYTDSIAGATDSSLIISTDTFALYTVAVTDSNGCALLSETFSYIGIAERSGDQLEGINWYPNPTQGMLTMSFDVLPATPVTVDVMQLDGTRISTTEVNSIKHNFDVSTLPNGMYLIRMEQAGQVGYQKIVKY